MLQQRFPILLPTQISKINLPHNTYTRVLRHWPVRRSQIFSVMSYEPLITLSSSTCRQRTVSLCPIMVTLQAMLDQLSWVDKSHTWIINIAKRLWVHFSQSKSSQSPSLIDSYFLSELIYFYFIKLIKISKDYNIMIKFFEIKLLTLMC